MILGVVNPTPDSFSDGGRYEGLDAAVNHAVTLFEAGADVVDIGGESTRPGAEAVDADVERARVIPIIQALSDRGLGPLSIDTTKAEVAEAALEAGAHWVNDISGLRFDPALADVAKAYDAPLILGHTRGRPRVMQAGPLTYEGGVLRGVSSALEASVALARARGVAEASLVLDPGLGFGKTLAQNLTLLQQLPALKALGFPVMFGASRKSFIGALTGRPVSDRLAGSLAIATLACYLGADLLRVHDVKETLDVLRVAEALKGDGE